jgi:hypothetical protein
MENENEDKYKTVKLDRALVFIIEDLAKRFGLESPNQVLNLLIRPVAHTIRASHGKRINVSFVSGSVSDSILLKFDVLEKFVRKAISNE